MMHNGIDPALGWIVFGLTVWLAAIGGAIALTIRTIHHPQPPPSAVPSPLEILERRFAAGKITREDFDEARARLREHELDV
jgi:putative membrane protein